MTKSSKKKKLHRHTGKKAETWVWVVESRHNYFVHQEHGPPREGYSNWKIVAECNVTKGSMYDYREMPINKQMITRTIEDCVPIALVEHARWDTTHQGTLRINGHSRTYVHETRLRNTLTGDIIPVELFL